MLHFPQLAKTFIELVVHCGQYENFFDDQLKIHKKTLNSQVQNQCQPSGEIENQCWLPILGSLCPKVTNFGSQNFGYQIWFCTRLLKVSPTSHQLISLFFHIWSIDLAFPEIWLLENLTLKVEGQTRSWVWSKSSPQSRSDILSTHFYFVPWRSAISHSCQTVLLGGFQAMSAKMADVEIICINHFHFTFTLNLKKNSKWYTLFSANF